MSNENYVPRFSFEISEEQRDRANNLISTHGLRKAIFSRLLDEVLDLIAEHGDIIIGALISPKVKNSDIVEPLAKAKSIGKKNGKSR